MSLIPSMLYCDTEVSGDVEGEWTTEGSPYIATDQLVVPNGRSLNIGAGVEVLFEGDYQFIINGQLTAEGSEDDSIYFRPSEEDADWGGLRFINADRNTLLSYCVVTGGRNLSGEGHGDLVSCGGNILIHRGDVGIENSRISNGQARGFGGGIAVWNSDPQIQNCLISENSSQECGGGIEVYLSSSPSIIACEFVGNRTGWDGGGVGIEEYSDPLVEDCIFSNNGGAVGGGIGMNSSSAIITRCDFTANTASVGGGIFISQGDNITIEWCDFYLNRGGIGGGGLGVRFGASPEVRYCRFFENQAPEGGALTVWSPPACHIHHNLFVRNIARYGGVFSSYERHPMGETPLSMTNCTFIDNRSDLPDSEPSIAFIRHNERLNLTSCIIQGGTRPFFNNPNRITVTYSHVQDGFGGQGNSADPPGLFMLDPLWCLLRGDSPCVDSGDPNLPDDPDDTRNDRGWIHFPQDAIDALDVDTVSVEMPIGERRATTIHFRNETGVPIYATPMDKWQSDDPEMIVNASAITDDSEISAVAWTSDGYLLAGGNSGESPNKLYRLNREFRLTGQFDQPGPWDSEPIWELAGDGDETLYGSAGDEIIEFYSNGEIGDVYGGPGGFQVCRGLGADFNYADDPPDIYIGGDEGLISRVDWEMHERQRYDAHYPVMAIGAKGNMRGIYLITEPFPSLYLLSLLITDDSLIVPLYRLIPPHGEYRVGGIEVTQDIQPGCGTLIGVWRGEGNNSDRLYILDLYTSWLAIRPDLKLLMPGEEAEWEVIFAGDQTAAGEYESEYYFAVNGCGEGGEILARMLLTDESVDRNPPLAPSAIMLSPAYPNPFNSRARFSYYLPQATAFRINLIDPTGRMVQTLFSGQAESGEYNGWIDADKLSSGMYYLRLETSRSAAVASVTVFK